MPHGVLLSDINHHTVTNGNEGSRLFTGGCKDPGQDWPHEEALPAVQGRQERHSACPMISNSHLSVSATLFLRVGTTLHAIGRVSNSKDLPHLKERMQRPTFTGNSKWSERC